MGLFDTVKAECPNSSCAGAITWQSKAGDCYMTTYDVRAVPAAVAGDVTGETGRCHLCGTTVRIEAMVPIPSDVPMRVVTVKDVR